MAVLALVATTQVSSAATGASAATITKHSGTWHVSGGILNNKTVNTPAYSTLNKAETCIHIKSNSSGSLFWTIHLVWFNAGNNTVLWTLKGRGTGTYCSGWRKMSHPDDKVYDAITAASLQSMTGTYNIWTN